MSILPGHLLKPQVLQDDHELTNNPWMEGAENHQETCEGGRRAGCQEHEGNYKERMRVAAQAYMEWMPIRNGPGDSGVAGISITQIIEWGNLATLAGFDTRLKARTEEAPGYFSRPSQLQDLYSYAATNTNVGSYDASTLKSMAADFIDVLEEPYREKLGQYQRNLLETTFRNSKAAGKPWQIFATQCVFGLNSPPNYAVLNDVVPGATASSVVSTLMASTGNREMAVSSSFWSRNVL